MIIRDGRGAPARAEQHGSAEAPVEIASARRVTCPDCGAAMQLRTVAGVEIDECIDCGTQWFDDGELATIVKARTAVSLEVLGPQRVLHSREAACPVCRRDTVAFGFNAAPGARGSVCDVHGQWLDTRGSRVLTGVGRKEARLTQQATTGPFRRRIERMSAYGWRLWIWAYSLKWGTVLTLALRGARVPFAYLTMAVVVSTLMLSEVGQRLQRLARPAPPRS